MEQKILGFSDGRAIHYSTGGTSSEALSRRTDPPTSREAAASMDARGKTRKQAEICLAEVRREPGQTAAEIAKSLGIERHIPSRRLPGLRDKGLVENWSMQSEYNLSGESEGEAPVETCSRICAVTGNRSMTWWPR